MDPIYVLFDATDGKIYYTVSAESFFLNYDETAKTYTQSSVVLDVLEVDPIKPDNVNVYNELLKWNRLPNRHLDVDGRQKYYMSQDAQTQEWEVNLVDGWEEYIDPEELNV